MKSGDDWSNAKTGETCILIRDGDWNVFESGNGEPIVFLHNGGGTLWNWEHQLQHFSPRYRVIAPDLPGFGRSHRPESLTLDNYVRDLSELLEVLGCRRPALVGNCIGSSIALEFALREPERVGALALFNICGGPPMLNRWLRFWAVRRPVSFAGQRIHQFIVNAAGHPLARRVNVPLIYGGGEPALPPALSHFLHMQKCVPGLRTSLYPLVTGLESFNVFAQARQKPAGFPPVLLGWGKQNRTLDVKWAGVIADWLCPNQFTVIEDAGHMPMYEQPGRVNEVLDAFLSSIGSR